MPALAHAARKATTIQTGALALPPITSPRARDFSLVVDARLVCFGGGRVSFFREAGSRGELVATLGVGPS